MVITSVNNKYVKDISKLKEKKYRDLENCFLVETRHLVEEAYKEGLLEELIILDKEEYSLENVKIIIVSKEVMKKISSTDSINPVMGVVKKKNSGEVIGTKVLILDNVQDPGNLGTIIRSSVALGIETLVLSLDTVDLYNPKVIRSSEGMIFHLNIVRRDVFKCILDLRDRGYQVIGTDVHGGVNVREFKAHDKYGLILGNEGKGIKKEILDMVDTRIYIPMKKECESLNVGVSAGIILYELNKEKLG